MKWGSVRHHELTIAPRRGRGGRRVCGVDGCPRKCTYVGSAGGVAMASGCHWHMWMWLRAHRRRQGGQT